MFKINYHNITKCDMLNGMGLRVVLWCSHCEHKCDDCHNKQTWSEHSGILFDENAKQEIFNELEKEEIKGLTCSGGDPLSIINREEITILLREIKEKYPNKDIWVYTGYTYEEIKDFETIKYIDILVDGKFAKELSVPKPKWRGSSNQRIINIPESLKQNKVVLYME